MLSSYMIAIIVDISDNSVDFNIKIGDKVIILKQNLISKYYYY